MAETREFTACHELKSIRQFNGGKTECKFCEETFRCSRCTTNKIWRNFSYIQMEKGEARKCRSCTGQGSSTLDCTECGKTLSLALFKKESRSPAVCNECRQLENLEELDHMNAYTGEYAGHGMWDTLTGADDGSGL